MREAGAAGCRTGARSSDAAQQEAAPGCLQHSQRRIGVEVSQSPAGTTAAKPKLIANATSSRTKLAMAESMALAFVIQDG